MIDAYVVPRIGRLELGKVDGATLNTLYAVLLENGRTGASGRSGGLSAKSVRNVAGLLHKAFSDAIKWQRLAVNPCTAADQPRKPEVELEVWTSDEISPSSRPPQPTGGADVEAPGDHRDAPRRAARAAVGATSTSIAGRVTIRQTLVMVGNGPRSARRRRPPVERTISLDAADGRRPTGVAGGRPPSTSRWVPAGRGAELPS